MTPKRTIAMACALAACAPAVVAAQPVGNQGNQVIARVWAHLGASGGNATMPAADDVTRSVSGALTRALKAHDYRLLEPATLLPSAADTSALQAHAREAGARGVVYVELDLRPIQGIRGTVLKSAQVGARVSIIDAMSGRRVGDANAVRHGAAKGDSLAIDRAIAAALSSATDNVWPEVMSAWGQRAEPTAGVTVTVTGVRRWRAVHRIRRALADVPNRVQVAYRRVQFGRVTLLAHGKSARVIAGILGRLGLSTRVRGNHVSVALGGRGEV